MGFDATSSSGTPALFVGNSFGVHRDGALNALSVGAGSFQSDSFANGGNRYLAVDDDGNFSATTDGSGLTNLPAPTFAQIHSFLYGGTPTITGLAESAGGLILTHTVIGKPTDSDFILSFNTSSVAQVMLTNLFRIDLSAAMSTNFLVITYNQMAWGGFTNTGTGAAAASIKFQCIPNPSSPSNSFFVGVGPQALNTGSTFTLGFHVGRP